MGKQLQTIQDRFDKFHAAHPDVYSKLCEYARAVVAAGYNNIGIALLYERLRWYYQIERPDGIEAYKLSNDFRSRYARLIMSQEADLQGFFKTRELESA
jgi:hypothetical protein